MDRSMVSGSMVRLREVGLGGTGVMERVRGVQSGRARTGDSKHQGQSSRASARKLHPVMIPSTTEFVLRDRPRRRTSCKKSYDFLIGQSASNFQAAARFAD
jgi:hypothetical protein